MSSPALAPFRPSPAAYATLAALWNRLEPMWPRDPDIWGRFDAGAAEPTVRYVATAAGVLVGAAEAERASHSAVPDAYNMSVYVDPVDTPPTLPAALHDAVVAALPAQGTPVLFAYPTDKQPALMDLYTQRGYVEVAQTAFSKLDLPRFDEEAFAERMASVREAGYRLVPASELAADDAAWTKRMHALHCAILEDVPADGGFAAPSLADFEKDLANRDRIRLEHVVVAVHGDTYVASSQVQPLARKQDGGFCSLTGTRRDHRRRGLAFALKVASAQIAKREGLAFLTTLNDAHNPMLALNHALGFVTETIQHTLRLDVPR